MKTIRRPIIKPDFRPIGGLRVTQPGAALLIMMLLIACTGSPAGLSDSSGGAGLPVAREFSAFYEEFGGREFFGDPVTEAFTIEDEGPLYQYFQALRLVYDDRSGLSQEQRISVSPLGEWALAGLNRRLPAPAVEGSESRHFPESGLAVSGDFLAFYAGHHGETVLGPPISVPLDRDGLIVQYFRNGRLDWYPELPDEQRIRLGSLGQAHFDAVMAFSYRQALSSQFVPAVSITAVEVFAYVQRPVLYAGDRQLLYVTVLTPEGRPVSGLTIQVTMSYGQRSESRELELAGDQNKVQLSLGSGDIPPGERVELTVSVLSPSGKLLGSDHLTFKTWW
jgi:hypothetical protein